jgi:hypothetical protein
MIWAQRGVKNASALTEEDVSLRSGGGSKDGRNRSRRWLQHEQLQTEMARCILHDF